MKKSGKTPFLLHIGNFFILASLLGIFYIYFPYIRLFLFLENVDSAVTASGMWLSIPKINASSPIITNIDPWNEKEYRKALKKGVAHAKGTALPSEKGMSFLFSHSSDLPWNITRYNTSFFRLRELKLQDEIIIYNEGERLIYKVVDKKEIWPDEVEYLKNSESELILQTCTPPGTSFKRLLIFAHKI